MTKPPRDPTRIGPILVRLEAVWRQHPDLRLGQIVINAHGLGTKDPVDLFYVEDDPLIDAVERFAQLFGTTEIDA